MTGPIAFEVSGTPRPQPRPRFVKGRVISTADPKAKLWRLMVKRAVSQAMDGREAFAGAVKLSVVFRFRPSSLVRVGQAHTQKPDADNLLKLVQDVMEECGVFRNDSQIAHAEPVKLWAHEAGMGVVVEEFVAEEEAMGAEGLAGAPGWLTGG
jgi:Holliday junction resolvase RusA-like endonuclease